MRSFFMVLGVLASTGLLLQCTSYADVCYGDACPPDTTGGDASVCDPVVDPSCVTEANGVFVNASSSSHQGTVESPYGGIQEALDAMAGKNDSRKSIFICGGIYSEKVLLKNVVSLYGGFDCTTWTRNGIAKSQVVSPDSQPALTVWNLGVPVTISDLSFDSQEAKSPGASSMAVFVVSSIDVTLRRVTATAGNGVTGPTPGDPPTNHNSKDPASAVSGTGAGPTICNCTDKSSSTGGKGGDGGAAATEGQAGSYLLAPPNDNVSLEPIANGGTGYEGGACGNGKSGANADAGGSGGAGAGSFGTLDKDGWHPIAGDDGKAGNPGQGGGGGGGGLSATKGGGGSGACGGCGGAGGLGGGGGGASIALASLQSTVTLTECTLNTGIGGAGGQGGNGEAGDSGPSGGDPTKDPNAGCKGGTGGNGAGGGGGGGGAGGISVGILYLGGKVTYGPDTQINPGSGGASGQPGDPGAGGNNGSNPAPSGVPDPDVGTGLEGIGRDILPLDNPSDSQP